MYLNGLPLLHCHPVSKSKLFSPIHRDVPRKAVNPASMQTSSCTEGFHNKPIMDISDAVPEMYDCSCSSTMLSSSAPCCWQLFRAWDQLNTDCVFLWYWTPVTGSVSQPEVPACYQDKAAKCKYYHFLKVIAAELEFHTLECWMLVLLIWNIS